MSLGLGAYRAGTSSAPSIFAASAQKIVDAWAAKQTVNRSPASPPTVTLGNTGVSTINGRALNQNGIVPTTSIPDGYSAPMNADSRWIVTKAASTQIESNRTYAPGNSKMPIFTGQAFDFKASVSSGKAFSIRWSEDNGATWNEVGPYVCTLSSWTLVDFGSAATRVVELICEDQAFQTYGFNFDTGTTPPEAWAYTGPAGVMLGDSYVFNQGAGAIVGLSNNQHATKGMCRQMAEYLGFLQIRNHGFRTNGWSNTQSGVQSNFKDRIDLPAPADNALSEGIVMGANRDFVVVPTSINDASATFDGTRRTDVSTALARLRAMQPNALIVVPFGANAPQLAEPTNWLNDMKNGFNDVFGTTEAEWIANGAYFIDGSRAAGAAWVPAGVAGSSAYFPASGDPQHPNTAGHAFFGEKYGDGLLYLAQQIVA